jgi:tRNA-Thr(GGU) m(6)t(6)A37 methyltransferase TsaA
MDKISLEPIGVWHTPLLTREDAPKQGAEDNIIGEIEIDERWVEGLTGIKPEASIWVLSYFNCARDPEMMIHPRGNINNPQTGLFNTRSPNRPNPIGLSVVKVLAIEGCRLRVQGTDALDGTPVLDIKPYITRFDG